MSEFVLLQDRREDEIDLIRNTEIVRNVTFVLQYTCISTNTDTNAFSKYYYGTECIYCLYTGYCIYIYWHSSFLVSSSFNDSNNISKYEHC